MSDDDRVLMKRVNRCPESGWYRGIYPSIPRPTLRLVDKVSRSCGHTPGKVAGQRATVKAEMNGFTPGLDRHPPSRWMGGQGGQSLKVLGRALSDFEVFSFSKLNNQNKFF